MSAFRLPVDPYDGILVLRTDYSDDAAYHRVLARALAACPPPDEPGVQLFGDEWVEVESGPPIVPLESAELAGLGADALAELPRSGFLGAVAVVDAQSLEDGTMQFVDLDELSDSYRRTFRSPAERTYDVASRLRWSHRAFAECVGALGPDGVLRTMPDPSTYRHWDEETKSHRVPDGEDFRLPESPVDGLLLLRTDYSDDARWEEVVASAQKPWAEAHDGVAAGDEWDDEADDDCWRAALEPVESPRLDGLTVEEIVALPRTEFLGQVAVVDAQSMRDGTLLYVDLDDEIAHTAGRSFRAVPAETFPIVANLSLANMDFEAFADSVDDDGVFRGFPEPSDPPLA